MLALLLVLIVVAVFALVLVSESSGEDRPLAFRPAGLLSWLLSGNWPAKVGAGLLIIGVGALLRYAFAELDVPPQLKLGSGAGLAALLGFASMALRNQPKRRAVHLALGGAAFGVAYLTAYSAYGFFNYLSDVNALALLALVAVATGAFAVSSNALSVAVLAMAGAYLAPKFAIGSPGVLPVYGYYLAASVLSLFMVIVRGWRPLIHLSFLFTLAGGLFFGWSGRFYEPAHYSLMQPLLLALTAVHLAMPLLEKKAARSRLLVGFDSAYSVILPLVAAALTLKIAPDWRVDGATGLAALALVWGFAAVVLRLLENPAMARHAAIAGLLALAAAFLYVDDLPWLLIGLGAAVAVLLAAPRLGWSKNTETLACALAVLFGAFHVIASILQPAPVQAFVSELFAHRATASVLMLVGATVAARRRVALSGLLGAIGAGWAGLSLLAELLRLHIDFLPQLVYGALLFALALNVVLSERLARVPAFGGVLICALVAAGWWAPHTAVPQVVVAFFVLTPLVLLATAWAGRDSLQNEGSDFSPSLAIGLLPFALLPWASATASLLNVFTDFFEATVAMAGVAGAGLAARAWLSASPRWNERIQPLHVYFTAFALLGVTLFHIERGLWPVLFETLALVYLVVYVSRRQREQAGVGFGVGAMLVIGVALYMQAMILRCFGPDDFVMDASDINRMHLPAVASLMWVIFGAGVTGWGTQGKSRTRWWAGAVLLLAAALKLVLFDFGALGQLGNILAFIAAGLVFLAVAWFAPMPPKAEPVAPVAARRQPQPPPAAGPVEEAVVVSAPSDTTPAATASLSPESLADDLSVPEASVPKLEKPVAPPRRVAPANRYRKETQGISGLWFLLLGAAIIVALSAAVWHKQTRLQQVRLERQHVEDLQRRAAWQRELRELERPIQVAPRPVSR